MCGSSCTHLCDQTPPPSPGTKPSGESAHTANTHGLRRPFGLPQSSSGAYLCGVRVYCADKKKRNTTNDGRTPAEPPHDEWRIIPSLPGSSPALSHSRSSLSRSRRSTTLEKTPRSNDESFRTTTTRSHTHTHTTRRVQSCNRAIVTLSEDPSTCWLGAASSDSCHPPPPLPTPRA